MHLRDDRPVPGRTRRMTGTAGRWLCGIRLGHGHRRPREWPYKGVRGSCQRGHRELTASPSADISTTFSISMFSMFSTFPTFSAWSNVAVRGWLGLRLLLLLGYHVARPAQAPGIILRARELSEDRSEGRAREDILRWTREWIVPAVRAMVPIIVGRIVGTGTRVLCLAPAGTRRWSRATPTAAVMAAVMPLGATRATREDGFRVTAIAVIEKGRVVVSGGIAHRHHL